MMEAKAKKAKHATLSTPRFFGLWVAAYLGASLFADFVLQGIIPDVWNIDSDFSSLLGFLFVFGMILAVFYNMQRQLLRRFLGASLQHWIRGSLAGWALGLTAIYIVEVQLDIAPPNEEAQQLRLVLFIVISTVLAQWWMLQNVLRSAWQWVAVHFAFILGLSFLTSSEIVLFTFSIFSAPEYDNSYDGSFLGYKILAILYGVVTGLTLIWLERNQVKEKRKGK